VDWPFESKVMALDVDGELLWDESVNIFEYPEHRSELDGVDSDNGVCYVWDEWVSASEAIHGSNGGNESASMASASGGIVVGWCSRLTAQGFRRHARRW